MLNKLSETQIIIIILIIIVIIIYNTNSTTISNEKFNTVTAKNDNIVMSEEEIAQDNTNISTQNVQPTEKVVEEVIPTKALECADIKVDDKCGGICKFIYADSLSADFMNGNLQGMYKEMNVPDMDIRCFNKADLANLNPSVYCRMRNEKSCLKDTEGKCFVDNGVCKSVNLELNGSCAGRCGINSVKGQTCSCSINCKDINNCCSDYDEKCEKVIAQQTMFDYSNLNLLTYRKYADADF